MPINISEKSFRDSKRRLHAQLKSFYRKMLDLDAKPNDIKLSQCEQILANSLFAKPYQEIKPLLSPSSKIIIKDPAHEEAKNTISDIKVGDKHLLYLDYTLLLEHNGKNKLAALEYANRFDRRIKRYDLGYYGEVAKGWTVEDLTPLFIALGWIGNKKDSIFYYIDKARCFSVGGEVCEMQTCGSWVIDYIQGFKNFDGAPDTKPFDQDWPIWSPFSDQSSRAGKVYFTLRNLNNATKVISNKWMAMASDDFKNTHLLPITFFMED